MLRQKAECFFWYQPTRVVPEQRPLTVVVVVVIIWPGANPVTYAAQNLGFLLQMSIAKYYNTPHGI